MNGTYIKCSHPETIKQLREMGLVVLSENNGIVTFLNDPSKQKNFSTTAKVVYTNKIEI